MRADQPKPQPTKPIVLDPKQLEQVTVNRAAAAVAD